MTIYNSIERLVVLQYHTQRQYGPHNTPIRKI